MNEQTILVVDDVKENLDILIQILKSHYKVKAAPNGMMALKIAQKTSPDLIFLDIIMPKMDGYEVIKELKNNASTANIPVVFVTSNDNENEKKIGMAMGAAGYLTKPFSPEKLLKMAKSILSN